MPAKSRHEGYSPQRVTFPLIAGSLQISIIVLFAIFGRYDTEVLPGKESSPHVNAYATFQDVHVMIFIGFGFLMTFLKRYGYSAVGVNFLIAAFCLQWACLVRGLLNLDGDTTTFSLNLGSLLSADFTAATVLISFGAVLGKASPTQLIIMALIETTCALINEYIGLHKLQVTDAGASLFVHTFGAYFGLAVARVLYRDDVHQVNGEGSTYHSDIFAMIGTVFLWLFWPSFNGGALVGAEQQRAFVNTYFSLCTSCVVTFIISWLCEGRYNMVHVQNATLAGGVAIGTAADMLVRPFGAMIIGTIAAIISVLGYKFLTPRMGKAPIKIHDTCGVNNLHGMPGILAGVIGAFMASSATTEQYGNTLFEKFPARLPSEYNSLYYNETLKHSGGLLSAESLNAQIESLGFGENRSAPAQAAYQFAALVITLAFALIAGTLTGFILRLPVFDIVARKRFFEDDFFWEVSDFDPRFPQSQPVHVSVIAQRDDEPTEIKEVTTPLVS